MKGGKQGREPKSGSSGRRGAERGKPKPGAVKSAATKRGAGGSPPKGSRKKPGYGGTSSAGED